MLKYCPQCKKEYKKRKRICDICKIKLTKREKYIRIEDWKKLCKGETIRITPGSGPVYYVSEENYINMGHMGEFVVEKVGKNGIHAYGKHGFAFIYMGPEKKAKSGTLLKPHKIRLKNVSNNNCNSFVKINLV